MLQKAFGDERMDKTQLKKWYKQFKVAAHLSTVILFLYDGNNIG